jgi:tetratricopeptide (TPR) repeat protein
MSEEAERLDARAEAAAVGADPAAVALALNAASNDSSIAKDAQAYLREQLALATDQRKLVQLQAKELAHELKLRHWSMLVRHLSGLLKLTLEVGLAVAAVALASFLGAAVWNAAHADGLVIESFSVPPELAARGLTGEVVASEMLDDLSEMNATPSNRAPQSYANNWSDDLKVEIPDTGISIGQAYRFLKAWLGHESHISGEVWRTETGLAITARITGSSAATVTGSSADVGVLVQKAAEDIYSRTQPYRYAQYIGRHGRHDETVTRYKSLALTGSPSDRGWAYNGWGVAISERAPISEREQLYLRATSYGVPPAFNNFARAQTSLGRNELALAYFKKALSLGRECGCINPASLTPFLKQTEAEQLSLVGDYYAAVASSKASLDGGVIVSTVSPSYRLADLQIGEHDLVGARASVTDPLAGLGTLPGNDSLARPRFEMAMAWELQDWTSFVSRAAALAPIIAKYPGIESQMPTTLQPQLAYAQAKLGHFAEAEALIAPTPGDCYPCLRLRAQIAQVRSQFARSDWWFARAAAAGPSLPFGESEWGQALLERGQPDAAITQFTIANQKGPHFADPLEGWGEALMAKNESHLALAKFAEAEKYAPNWGRLHLKWGEALVYAGRKDEAKAQFARAAQLDLTLSEKTELARHPN